MKGLDFVVAEARRYGIKLILSLANNYESFGGKKQYVDWARSRGQYLSSDDDFFRNSVVKGYYKNHIRVSARTLHYFHLTVLLYVLSCTNFLFVQSCPFIFSSMMYFFLAKEVVYLFKIKLFERPSFLF